jgi:hypothetical protein
MGNVRAEELIRSSGAVLEKMLDKSTRCREYRVSSAVETALSPQGEIRPCSGQKLRLQASHLMGKTTQSKFKKAPEGKCRPCAANQSSNLDQLELCKFASAYGSLFHPQLLVGSRARTCSSVLSNIKKYAKRFRTRVKRCV